MSDSEQPGCDVFDVERIRRLVELMKAHDLSEIDLRQAEQQIRLSRGSQNEVRYVAPSLAPGMPMMSPPPAAVASASVPAEVKGARDESHLVLIKSPMVGTFFSRPNPKSEPFVRVGDFVEADQTICLIEAMKVFNEIPAEVRGRIVAILADDEEPVEFGKPLFKVDTSK